MPAWRVIAGGVLLGPLAAPFSTCLAHEVPHFLSQQYRWVDGSPGAKFLRTYTPYSKKSLEGRGGPRTGPWKNANLSMEFGEGGSDRGGEVRWHIRVLIGSDV